LTIALLQLCEISIPTLIITTGVFQSQFTIIPISFSSQMCLDLTVP
jgi:hypothetical protein